MDRTNVHNCVWLTVTKFCYMFDGNNAPVVAVLTADLEQLLLIAAALFHSDS